MLEINPQEKKMTHCPECNKPVLNNGQFSTPVTFSIRCPWCQSNLKVSVQIKVITELAEVAEVEELEHQTAESSPQPA